MLLALLALGGQLLGTAHLLLMPHAVCAEHGELIHLHDGVAAEDAAHHESPVTTQLSVPEAAEADAHEHCLASALRRDQLALYEAPSTLILVSASQAVARVERSVHAPKSVAILLLAPKSSPPSLAA